MPNWKKVIVSGSSAALTSVTATAGFTGSLSGSATTATSASYALTASYVNTLNQSVIITSSAAIGTSSLGPSENTLTLGARDAASEGGQIGFNAPGGTYTSASFIDNWQNKARILKGNNTTSTGLIAQWDIHTTQLSLPAYTSATSFVGTATANLAVDSGGNVITVSTTGGSVFPYVGNAVITGSLTVTQPVYIPINGNMYLQGGDDAALYDVNIVNTMGIYGVQDVTVGAVKLGSNGPVLYGSGSRLGINTTNPSSASLTVSGNVWATSFTGSLQGTASYATQALSASYATQANTSYTASYVLNAISASYSQTASYVNPLNQNVLITGSLIVSSSNGALTETTAFDSNSVKSVDFPNRILIDLTTNPSADWASRYLYLGGTAVVDWGNLLLSDPANVGSLDWNSRYGYDSSGTIAFNWGSRDLIDSSNTVALNWNASLLNYKIEAYTYFKKLLETNTQELFSDVPIVGFNYEGEIIGGVLDNNVALFDLIYLETDGIWYQTTQGTTDCSKLLGICTNANPGREEILLEGSLTVNNNSLTDSPYVQLVDHGLPIYIRGGSGTQMSTTQPSSAGSYVRILGHAYYQNVHDSQYWTMKFRPSNDWYVI